VSGDRPHFNYISFRVDHSLNRNRAANPALSGQDGKNGVGSKDESWCLHFSTDMNRALRCRSDWRWSWRDSTGRASAEHAAKMSSGHPTSDAITFVSARRAVPTRPEAVELREVAAQAKSR